MNRFQKLRVEFCVELYKFVCTRSYSSNKTISKSINHSVTILLPSDCTGKPIQNFPKIFITAIGGLIHYEQILEIKSGILSCII